MAGGCSVECRRTMEGTNTNVVDVIESDARRMYDELGNEMRETHEVAYEDDSVVVFIDEHCAELGCIADDIGVQRHRVAQWHHEKARLVCDHSWSVVDPVVALKD